MILNRGANRDESGGSIDLGHYITYDGPALEPAAFDGAALRLSIVRPPVLQPAPGPGRCRRPVEGPVAGYLVNRTFAVAGALDAVDDDGDGPAWSVGDRADVYPVRAVSRACERCWACRLPRVARALELAGRAVAVVRRRNVTIAVVALMVVPGAVLLLARWLL